VGLCVAWCVQRGVLAKKANRLKPTDWWWCALGSAAGSNATSVAVEGKGKGKGRMI